ncbi:MULTISPECIES: sensor histidine kinase [unclassified Sphingomonas]|nr:MULTISPECIES: histidine kinase [unclassified Sphingomonas]KTF68351.1 hypothetical protein ATB93_14505 [Sphingomonas sp. WG]
MLALVLLSTAPLRASGSDGWGVGPAALGPILAIGYGAQGRPHAASGYILPRDAAARPNGAPQRIGTAPGVQGWPFPLFGGAALVLVLWAVHRARLRFVARRIRSRLLDRLRERERVARDIHDSLLQAIQALMLRFQLVADSLPPGHPARRDLDTAMDEVDAVVAQGRDRLDELRRFGGFEDPAAALRAIADRQLGGSGVVPVFRSRGRPRPLDPLAWEALASIAAEWMLDIARHGHAAAMEVEIAYRAHGLALRIGDDGMGFLLPPVRDGGAGHPGVAKIHARAGRIGGSVRLSPRRGGGTLIVVTVAAPMVYRSLHDTR